MIWRTQTLRAAEERREQDVAAALRIGVATMEWTRRRFVEEGLKASLREHPCPGARPVVCFDETP